MKRILLFLLLFSSAASAQISPYWGVSRVNTKGYWNLRLRSDSALHLPRKYALELNDNDTTPQIFVKGNELIYFSAGNYYPVSGGSSIDTNYWNNKIYSRVLIADTANSFGGRFLTSIGGIAAGGDLSGNYPNPTVAYFNGQLPSYYLNYNNLSNKPTFVGNIERIEGKDSIIFWIGSTRYAIKDSTGAGIASINGLTGATQTFAVGTSGTNFNITSSGSTHTFNIPDASAYNRGLITTTDQVISGNKTFGGTVRAEYFYIGSLSGASATDSLLTINYSTGEVKRLNRNAFISTETDPTIYSWAKASTKPSYSWSEIDSKPNIIDSIRSVKSLLFNSPSTFTLNGTTGVITETLASQAANSVFRTTTAGTPSFGTLDSTHVPALHSESYYNTKYAAIGGGVDSTAYHTVSVINDSSFVLCDLHSNCDTIVIAGTDTSNISRRIDEKGRVDSIRLVNTGVLHTTPATFSLSGKTAVVTQTLASQAANSVFRTTTAGTPSFGTLDSTHVPALHSESYYNTKYAAIGGGGGSGWSLTGNATTFPNTYLGTTGSATIRFITNNVQRMRIDSVGRTFIDSLYFGRGTGTNYNNVAIGDSALQRNTTGNGNTAIGDSALQLNTTGLDNTAIGTKAGRAITTNSGNTIIGSNAGLAVNSIGNTAVGNEALKAAAGNFNTAMGFYALKSNLGARNVGFGVNALVGNTAGSGNIAIGYNAAATNLTGSSIVVIGDQAVQYGTGNYTTAVGAGTLPNLTTGIANSCFGYNTGWGITTGSNNVIIGGQASALPGSRSNYVIINDGQGNAALTRDSLYRTGLGTITTPTALLHIAAGTTTIAPIKLTSGTNLTTPVAGSIEYDGTNLFFTRTGTTRESVITANAVNTVSPTSPNRTITVVIDGTTYYLSAKTTND